MSVEEERCVVCGGSLRWVDLPDAPYVEGEPVTYTRGQVCSKCGHTKDSK